MKLLVRQGRVPVVGVDENVVRFDAGFRNDTGVASMQRLLRLDAPPIDTTFFVR